jgi:hypothetical protein
LENYHIEKIEYAKVDKLGSIVKFILDYVDNNTKTTAFLSPTLLYQELSKSLSVQNQLSERQYFVLLNFLKEYNYIRLAIKGKTFKYSKEDYIDAIFLEDTYIIVNPNALHNKLCKEFDIDCHIEFNFEGENK